MSPEKMTIGQRIKELRLVRRVDQMQLAHLVGVRPETISRWENDKNPPDRASLAMIAGELRASLVWLEAGTGPMDADASTAKPPAIDDGTSEDYVRIKVSTHEELIEAALAARKLGRLSPDEEEAVEILRGLSPEQRTLALKLLRRETKPQVREGNLLNERD